ncbi:MarR family transcriptional regulator [Roseibacterium sp. SDUM158017]|uniref:MarR family winged helix-turn-helix transcriptional regulator n=1 Tax=Roseicyclus salinarum TaxID=3036773 RepID=UPI0024151844|nr:MarR family transcriptional regulator [Roseibacterium sp. SDUM158017]MDG4647315.1 MarR family transcriptional regulator [Roseibacterium sp. SDUM158017]
MSGEPVDPRDVFRVFNEIAIIEQLSRALFEARLPHGVLASHFGVLNHLVRVADGRTPLELARAFQVPKTTLSHTLMLLERRGWISMRANPEDRRSKRVWITEAGRAFREDAIAALLPDIEALLGRIDGTVLAELLPRLEEVRRVLDDSRDLVGARPREKL